MRWTTVTIGLVSFGTRADRGWGVRVHSLLLMASSFSSVRVFHTEPSDPADEQGLVGNSILSDTPNTEAIRVPSPETTRTSMSRFVHYYRNDVPTVAREVASQYADEISCLQIESLDLMFLTRAFGDSKLPVVLDEHNVYWNMLKYGIFDSPFFRGKIGGTRVARGTLGPWLLRRARQFERNAIEKAAKVIVTSEVDGEIIAKEIPSSRPKLTVIPNCVDVRTYALTQVNLSAEPYSRKVVFVGRLDYEANADAVRIICNEIAPRFGNTVRFQIVGGPIPPLSKYPSNVEFLGIVRDIRPILQDADVCIAPLRFGSGTRIKIIEYLAMGKPVVTTPLGCEGLAVEDGRNILVAQDPADQARQIQQTLDDRQFASSIGREGRKLAEEKYDWRVYVPRLRSLYESIDAI